MRKPTKRLPWVITTTDATETARHLIAQAGGVHAAHTAVTRAAKAQKKPHGRPSENDTTKLLIAAAIQKENGCSRASALTQVARLHEREEGVAKLVRRLTHKLGKKTLATFARRQRLEATREKDGFAFRLRK